MLAALALLLGIWCVPCVSHAQAMLMLLFGDKIVTKNFQPGITANFVGTGFWGGISNDMRLSWSLGIYGEIRLTKSLTLQPEFMFKNPNGARDMSTKTPAYPFEPVGEPTLDDVIETGRVTRELRAVAIPVLLKWVVGPVGLGVGPQFNILTNANDTVEKKDGKEKFSLSQGIYHELRPYDIGVVSSVECAFSRQDHLRAFRARLRFVLGLVDTVKDNPRDPIRNWAVTFGIDIPIGAPKKPKQEPEPAPG